MNIYGCDLFMLVNFMLSLLVFCFGCWAYAMTKNKAPFYIGVSFGLFSLSHLITIVGMESGLRDTIILVRTFSYFIVMTTLYYMGLEIKKK